MANINLGGGGGPGSDTSAIHVDEANEISGIPVKAVPTVADVLVGEDAANGFAKIQIPLGSLPTVPGDADQLIVPAIKGTAGTLPNGSLVYITGFDVGNSAITVELARADSAATMPAYGFTTSAIDDVTPGTVSVAGTLTGQNTAAFAVGEQLYVSDTIAGAVQNTRPEGATLVQSVGVVDISDAVNGAIQVTGAFRVNDLPNLPQDFIWVGSAAGVPVAVNKSTVGAPLTNAAPVDVTKAAAAVGVATESARADHKHDASTAIAGAIAIADTAAEGTATSLARSDHRHSLAAPAAPADVTKAAAAAGASSSPARADHKHDVATAAPVSVGTANAEGAATTLARSNHVHSHGNQPGGALHAAAVASGSAGFMTGADKQALDDAASLTASAPANVDKSVAVVGVATDAARADHKHDVDTAAPPITTTLPNATAGEGVATTVARSDHSHEMVTAVAGAITVPATATEGTANAFARADHTHSTIAATPVAIGTTNQPGSATNMVKGDHVHAHGDQTAGSLHAQAIAGGASGFMSGADKTAIDEAIVDSDFAGAYAAALQRTGAGAYAAIKNNLTAIVDPTAVDDSASDYAASSLWLNTVDETAWMCMAAGVGVAVWTQVSAVSSPFELGTWRYGAITSERFNSAPSALKSTITSIELNDIDLNGDDQGNVLSALVEVGTKLFIQKTEDRDDWVELTVATKTDAGATWQFGVSVFAENGPLSLAAGGGNDQGYRIFAIGSGGGGGGGGQTDSVTGANGVTNTGTNVNATLELAAMAANTIRGNATGGSAQPTELTGAQVNVILPVFTDVLKGSVPASGGGTTNFLRADGTFAPAGGGGGGGASALSFQSVFRATTATMVGSDFTFAGGGIQLELHKTQALPLAGAGNYDSLAANLAPGNWIYVYDTLTPSNWWLFRIDSPAFSGPTRWAFFQVGTDATSDATGTPANLVAGRNYTWVVQSYAGAGATDFQTFHEVQLGSTFGFSGDWTTYNANTGHSGNVMDQTFGTGNNVPPFPALYPGVGAGGAGGAFLSCTLRGYAADGTSGLVEYDIIIHDNVLNTDRRMTFTSPNLSWAANVWNTIEAPLVSISGFSMSPDETIGIAFHRLATSSPTILRMNINFKVASANG